MGVKDKLKNVWKEYKNTQQENKDAALDYYNKHIKDKSISYKIKNSIKIEKKKQLWGKKTYINLRLKIL